MSKSSHFSSPYLVSKKEMWKKIDKYYLKTVFCIIFSRKVCIYYIFVEFFSIFDIFRASRALKKTCTPSGEEELDDTATSNATKYLKDLLAFLKDEPPPLEESSEEDEDSSETNGTSDEV